MKTEWNATRATGFRLLHLPTHTLLRSVYSSADSARAFARYLAPRTAAQYDVVPATYPAPILMPVTR